MRLGLSKDSLPKALMHVVARRKMAAPTAGSSMKSSMHASAPNSAKEAALLVADYPILQDCVDDEEVSSRASWNTPRHVALPLYRLPVASGWTWPKRSWIERANISGASPYQTSNSRQVFEREGDVYYVH